MLCLSYYPLCFLFNKIGEQEGRPGSAQKQGVGEEVAQTMYTHMNKYKANKKNEKNEGHTYFLTKRNIMK
jgi:hypothetical protein